jgi:hydrogenase maturation protease
VDSELLVIGYGNTLRRDDGVGPRVAETIEALGLAGVKALARPLLTPELADPVSKAGAVVFVDASAKSPPEPVRMRRLEPADSSQMLTHAADPRTLLALARDAFGRAPDAWWLTVPAEELGIGDQLSASGLLGMKRAVKALRDFHRRHRGGS